MASASGPRAVVGSVPEIAFYGDDFTGSTDVLEVLTLGGLRSVLFTRAPSDEDLGRHAGAEAIGVAGTARTLRPAQLRAELPPVLRALRALGSRFLHYKVCSTFDSSPEVGSIGVAIELARELGAPAPVPLVLGAPALGRYSVFGTLFATTSGVTYRIDRHPTLSVHPVTPMTEADVLVHLAKQTDLALGLVSMIDTAVSAERIAARFGELAADGAEVILLDVFDDESLSNVGRFLSERPASDPAGDPALVVGSSGVEYALLKATGSGRRVGLRGARPAAPTLVVSGSRARATADQIEYARDNGFLEVRLRPDELGRQPSARAVAQATEALAAGRSVVVHLTDDRTDRTGAELGRSLGRVAREIVDTGAVTRLVVAGGDTSGLVVQSLGVVALELVEALTPGAPLCLASADDPSVDGIELCLKGGQIGAPDYFVRVAALGGSREPDRSVAPAGSSITEHAKESTR